jgi:hypothetical protein
MFAALAALLGALARPRSLTKRFLGRSIEVMVTSVLHTTAGKMFFGHSEIGEDHVVAEARPRRAGA